MSCGRNNRFYICYVHFWPCVLVRFESLRCDLRKYGSANVKLRALYSNCVMWDSQEVFGISITQYSLLSPCCLDATVVSRPNDLPEREGETVLQGVPHRPGRQTETHLRRRQTVLRSRWWSAAQYRNREWAAADREVHPAAAGWRCRLLDCSPSWSTAQHGGDHQPRLSLTLLLAGWKQGQDQVCLSFWRQVIV